MARGLWIQTSQMNRCSGSRLCRRCAEDPQAHPHGPYHLLQRRQPDSGKHEKVYVGRQPLDPHFLDNLNTNTDRSRQTVMALLASP